MKKNMRVLAAWSISLAILMSACTNSSKIQNEGTVENQPQNTAQSTIPAQNEDTSNPATGNDNTASEQPEIDLMAVKPNEAGKVMIVMFHNFIEEYKSGDKEYTTTFDNFRKLLETLYDKGYRLVSMKDYLNNEINVAPGHIPMVFTFDDGTAGQFNLVEENGALVANKRSAVGVMEEFSKEHPDFGLKGTFYVNLGDNTFIGAGTLEQRLKYLTDKGFEIGNHTLNHFDLKKAQTADQVREQVGGNQKAMEAIMPGYRLETLALPLGHWTKDELDQYVTAGEFEGVGYSNDAIMLVGANPAPSPVNVKFKPLSTPRVRATGIKAVEADLDWWLENMSLGEQYVSDGNPGTVTVPKAKEETIDKARLNGKKLIVY